MRVLIVLTVLASLGFSVVTAGTLTERFQAVHEQPTPGISFNSCTYFRAVITELEDRAELECWGEGSQCCRWFDPNGTQNRFSDPNGLFQLGQAQALFDYADAQVSNGTHSGSYTANYTVGSITYYRNVAWTYSTTTQIRDALVTITQVTP